MVSSNFSTETLPQRSVATASYAKAGLRTAPQRAAAGRPQQHELRRGTPAAEHATGALRLPRRGARLYCERSADGTAGADHASSGFVEPRPGAVATASEASDPARGAGATCGAALGCAAAVLTASLSAGPGSAVLPVAIIGAGLGAASGAELGARVARGCATRRARAVLLTYLRETAAASIGAADPRTRVAWGWHAVKVLAPLTHLQAEQAAAWDALARDLEDSSVAEERALADRCQQAASRCARAAGNRTLQPWLAAARATLREQPSTDALLITDILIKHAARRCYTAVGRDAVVAVHRAQQRRIKRFHERYYF